MVHIYRKHFISYFAAVVLATFTFSTLAPVISQFWGSVLVQDVLASDVTNEPASGSPFESPVEPSSNPSSNNESVPEETCSCSADADSLVLLGYRSLVAGPAVSGWVRMLDEDVQDNHSKDLLRPPKA